jgi:hypothetical protein
VQPADRQHADEVAAPGHETGGQHLIDRVAEPVVLGLLHLVDDEEVELAAAELLPAAAVGAEECDRRAVRERARAA